MKSNRVISGLLTLRNKESNSNTQPQQQRQLSAVTVQFKQTASGIWKPILQQSSSNLQNAWQHWRKKKKKKKACFSDCLSPLLPSHISLLHGEVWKAENMRPSEGTVFLNIKPLTTSAYIDHEAQSMQCALKILPASYNFFRMEHFSTLSKTLLSSHKCSSSQVTT